MAHSHLSNDNTVTTSSLKETVYNLPLIVKMFFALAAGALFPLALAPYEFIALAIVSPAILYILLYKVSARHAFFIGEAYGVGLWCVGAFWLFTSIHIYGKVPVPLALLMILAMGLLMGLFHGFMTWLFRKYMSFSPLSFSAMWVMQEWLRTWVLTGFPWLFLGYAYTGTFIDAYAPMLGIYAISFIGVFFAAALVEVLTKRLVWLLPVATLLIIALATQSINWTQPTQQKPLKVTLIQGNIPQDMKWLTEYREETLKIYNDLSKPFWGKTDVVVWPESAIPMFQIEILDFMSAIAQHAEDTNTTWITGVPFAEVEKFDPQTDAYPPFYNSIIALGADASGRYNKQRLVPFGEYIPFKGKLNWLLPEFIKSQGIMDFSLGETNQKPLQIKDTKLSAAVCYEVAYPDLTRKNAKDSNFLITVSNDAWFKDSDGPLQHVQMVQMRAREVGRWFIRATNTGLTAFIDNRGNIVATSERFKRNTLTHELPAYTGTTPYMRFGNLPIFIISLLILFFSVLIRRKQQKKKADIT